MRLMTGKRGMVVFGHDHIGHGESDGSRAYIENVDHYVDDVITHCMKMQAIFKTWSPHEVKNNVR